MEYLGVYNIMCAIKNLKRLKAEPIEYFKKKFDNMTKRIWMSLTVIVVNLISVFSQ